MPKGTTNQAGQTCYACDNYRVLIDKGVWAIADLYDTEGKFYRTAKVANFSGRNSNLEAQRYCDSKNLES